MEVSLTLPPPNMAVYGLAHSVTPPLSLATPFAHSGPDPSGSHGKSKKMKKYKGLAQK